MKPIHTCRNNLLISLLSTLKGLQLGSNDRYHAVIAPLAPEPTVMIYSASGDVISKEPERDHKSVKPGIIGNCIGQG